MRHTKDPAWRWIRARRLADNNLNPSRSRDDRFTHRAFRFVKRLRRLDLRAEERLSCDYPDIYDAFKIYDDTKSGTRWVFEASVMAAEPVEKIAEYLSVPVETLKVYEALYFDVREQLKHRGWVLSNVLMPAATCSVSARDPDVFWKAIAYFGGWDAVQASWEMGSASPAALDFFTKAIRQRISKNAFDALHTLQTNSFNAHESIKSAQEQRRLDHETETPATGDAVHESLGALLTSLGRMNVTPARAILPQEEPRLQEPGIIDVPALPVPSSKEDKK